MPRQARIEQLDTAWSGEWPAWRSETLPPEAWKDDGTGEGRQPDRMETAYVKGLEAVEHAADYIIAICHQCGKFYSTSPKSTTSRFCRPCRNERNTHQTNIAHMKRRELRRLQP